MELEKNHQQKQKTINEKSNFPIDFCHKDRKSLRKIVLFLPFPFKPLKISLNGLKKKNGYYDDVTKIEICLEALKRMNIVSVFKNLTELMLVRVYIKKIEGLDEMNQLESLWLNENKLKVISGL